MLGPVVADPGADLGRVEQPARLVGAVFRTDIPDWAASCSIVSWLGDSDSSKLRGGGHVTD